MRKNLIIGGLSVGLIASIIAIIYLIEPKPAFLDPAPNSKVKTAIDNYRVAVPAPNETYVITYTEREIRDYLNGAFKSLTSSMRLQNGYHWEVGFYMKLENGRKSFYVIPTMQQNDDKGIIDYFKNQAAYDDGSGINLDLQKTGYDAGHLWP